MPPRRPQSTSFALRHNGSFVADPELSSIEGARTIISAISSWNIVTSLSVTNTNLGVDGFRELFAFLTSDGGCKYPIAKLDLHDCGMDDSCLLILSEYLHDNRMLNTLLLQQNSFGQDVKTVSIFTRAINSSRLQTLIMSSMPPETAARFVTGLMEELNQPHLQNLVLSFNNLPITSAHELASFIISPRCHLRTLRLSANRFGHRGVRHLIAAMEKNYTLVALETYANEDSEDNTDIENVRLMIDVRERQRYLQERNDRLRKLVQQEALQLLRYSRALLLGQDTEGLPRSPSLRPLPMEIQLHILSFIAPSLSDTQRVRIFKYASTRSTLPSLLPRLMLPVCIRDPSSFSQSRSGECNFSYCGGLSTSLLCRREKERQGWLTEVGCDSYNAAQYSNSCAGRS